jgi:hypothetical protein
MKKDNSEPTKRDIEEVARMLASKLPKMTNFDNTKTRKYFSGTGGNSSDMRNSQMTLKDTLIYNCNNTNNSISTANKNDSITSSNVQSILFY